MYVCIYVCMYIYIYIYIHREREREREREGCMHMKTRPEQASKGILIVYSFQVLPTMLAKSNLYMFLVSVAYLDRDSLPRNYS